MTETNDYTPQLKKSIEWAKQTRWCVECQTMTPHEKFDERKHLAHYGDDECFMDVYLCMPQATSICGLCGTTTGEVE